MADPLDALAALLAAGGEDEVRLPLADGRSRRMHATVGAWPAHGEREGWAIVLRPPGTRLRPDAGALVTDALAWLEGAAPG